MGLLDSMLGELVRRETGFNARPLLRRIGSKRLLMMGGAALAGGLLAQQAQRSTGSSTGASSVAGGGAPGSLPRSSPGAPRPLPPVPGRATPLPPVPTQAPPVPSEVPPLPPEPVEEAGAQQAEETAVLYAVVRTMVAAALADGVLEPTEKKALEEQVASSRLDEEQQAQIRRDLLVPAGPGELAAGLPEGEDPEMLLQFAILVLRADGELEEPELRWLRSLAAALGFPPDRTDGLVRELAGELFEAETG